ncbi:TPA: phage major capsid protein [Escherichia coli]
MAVDIKDVEQVAQELQQKFDDFKAKNDKRVDAIEQEKGKLAGQVETLNGKLSELENLKSDLEKELLELKRPAGGAQNKLATEHKEAFVGFLRKGREDGLRDLERKALQVGTDEDGGYAVPEALDRNILTLLKDEVVMRQEATVITVGGSDYKKLVNLGGTASGWVGETDARSQTATSKLGLIEPFMGEIYGNPQATQKMLDDAFFNVEAWINSELATEFAEQEEIAFTTGDGTKKPKGFLAYESTDETDKVRAFGKLQHIVSGDATAVTADAIIKLIYTLRKAHRTGAKFMMNNNSLFAIRLLKDSEGTRFGPGQAIVTPAVIKGELLATYRQLERAGIVENYELFKQYLVVERDASDPNRLNTLFPPDYVNQLRVFAVVNQFRLQYSEESA